MLSRGRLPQVEEQLVEGDESTEKALGITLGEVVAPKDDEGRPPPMMADHPA